jgi:hypothetical protein
MSPVHYKGTLERVSKGSFAALVLTVVSAGLTLMAEGLRNFQTYALKRESSKSESPIPYGGHFGGWEPVVRRFGLESDWYIVLAPQSEDQSSDLACRNPIEGTRPSTTVLVMGEQGRFGELNCSPRDMEPKAATITYLRQPPESLGSGAGALLREGFVVLDSMFDVVYGSKRISDLSNVGDVLALFRHE